MDPDIMEETNTSQGTSVEEVEVGGSAVTDDTTSEWIDILGSGDLKKKVIKAGIVETRPKRGDTVKTTVSGRLNGGEVVDARDDLVFTLGDGEVLEGLELVIPLMDKSEVAEVFIASRFAYGTMGLRNEVPPDSDLIYTITLVDFKLEEDPCDLSIQERKLIGNRKRERGNWWYNREEYAHAIQCYKAACDFLDEPTPHHEKEASEEVRGLLDERLKAFNNMAAAQIKLQAYDVALKSVEVVLMCQSNNVKALFRKGKIYGICGKTKEGIQVLKTALEVEPENRLIHNELVKLREQAKKEAEEERSFYGRMFGFAKTKPTIELEEPKRQTISYKFFFSLILSFFCILTLLTICKTIIQA